MLKEITVDELLRRTGCEKILIMSEASVWTLADYLDETRILIDEAEEKEEEAPKEPKKRRSRKELEETIVKAWNNGERTIAQVMEMTGATYNTVRRYLPVSKEG